MKWTPYLSLLTIILEFLFIFISFNSKKEKHIKIPAISILILLLSYQIIEALICYKIVNRLIFSKIAFMVILWLPAIGLNLILSIINGRKSGFFFYIFAVLLSLMVLFDKNFVKDVHCLIFWAKYQTKNLSYLIYSIYYELGQIAMIFLSIYGMVISNSYNRRIYLGLILIGTLFFVLFGFMFVVIVPSALGALPSVMCHLAIFLALALTILLKIRI